MAVDIGGVWSWEDKDVGGAVRACGRGIRGSSPLLEGSPSGAAGFTVRRIVCSDIMSLGGVD